MSGAEFGDVLATIIYPLLFGSSVVLALLAWLSRYPRMGRWETVALHAASAVAFAIAALITGIYPALDYDTHVVWMRLSFAGALVVYLVVLGRTVAVMWMGRHRRPPAE